MLKQLFRVGFLVCVALGGRALAAEDVDQLIAHYTDALGGYAQLKAIKSARFSGSMTLGPGTEASFTLEFVPNEKKMRLEFATQGQLDDGMDASCDTASIAPEVAKLHIHTPGDVHYEY